ncbi:hypothetical protein [Candidatus Enterococcus murrayae]|uniref:Uncharacterized protein n=1 Tax=Candidatus Enterococcus murrayae TaxID=2815321 RepID=A0ABS3HED1_9ENTE|nr:hypothetical protein [Enterococcus sp. MJM16]MBO0451583.1 hypothetical protein [Enterococcus sp. MJM16]
MMGKIELTLVVAVIATALGAFFALSADTMVIATICLVVIICVVFTGLCELKSTPEGKKNSSQKE